MIWFGAGMEPIHVLIAHKHQTLHEQQQRQRRGMQ